MPLIQRSAANIQFIVGHRGRHSTILLANHRDYKFRIIIRVLAGRFLQPSALSRLSRTLTFDHSLIASLEIILLLITLNIS